MPNSAERRKRVKIFRMIRNESILFRILPAPPGQEYYWKYSGELPGFHHREGLSGKGLNFWKPKDNQYWPWKAVSFFGTLYAFGGRGPFVERFTCSMYATYYWDKCGQKLRESRPGFSDLNFDTFSWYPVRRYGHRSIVHIDAIYHIGGSYNETTK